MSEQQRQREFQEQQYEQLEELRKQAGLSRRDFLKILAASGIAAATGGQVVDNTAQASVDTLSLIHI